MNIIDPWINLNKKKKRNRSGLEFSVEKLIAGFELHRIGCTPKKRKTDGRRRAFEGGFSFENSFLFDARKNRFLLIF